MKIFRHAAAILLGLMAAGVLSAQTTTTTATIQDSDGSVWINAPYTVNIVSPIPPVTSPGNQPFTYSFSGTTNGSGTLSVTLQRVANIFPANTTWKFCVTPAVATQTYCVNVPVGNAGQSTEDVSSQINAVIQPPRISGSILAQGYADVEFQNVGGNQYYNISTNTFRCYTTSWAGCGGGGGGSVSLTSSNGSLTINPSPLTNTGTLDINLAHANTWTAGQTFNAGATIAANQQIGSSDGSSAAWAIETVAGSFSVMSLTSSVGNAGAISALEATSNSWSGLYTAGAFGTPVPTFVRTGSLVAGSQLTDSATGDPLVIAPSGNTVRVGITGAASILRANAAGVSITGAINNTGTVTMTGIQASSGSACLHINASGAVTNTGSDCGSGSGGLPTAPGASYIPASTGAGTTYAAVNNIDWTSTFGLGWLNGTFYVDGGAGFPTSCTVSSVAYTTAFDCAYANAKAWAVAHSNQNATLIVGSDGILTTNVGIQEPTATSNHATVNVIGRGINSSYLQLATSLSAGVCMVTQPDEVTAGNSAYLTVMGMTLDMNSDADCAMNIDGIKSSSIRDVKAINVRTTALNAGGYVFKFGGISSNPNGLVFETFIDNVSTDGLAGGFTPAIISACTLSSGNPVCAVTDGGAYPGSVGQVFLHGVGNGGGPCSVYPTPSLSFTGTALTSVTFTGGTCAGTVYASVTPPAVADNAFLFNSGFTDSTIKDIRAVVATNYATVKVLGHPNVFIHAHPYAGQPVGIEDYGSDIYMGTECDSLGGFCAALEGPGTRITDTQSIYNSPTRYAGSGLYYLDQSVTAPTLNAAGVTCNGNRQAAGGYHQLVIGTGLPYNNTSAAGGAVDAGYAIPNDNIQLESVFDCSSPTTTNAFISHIGTTTFNGRVKIAPAFPATATTTSVNSPILDQIGYAWNSGLVTNDWQFGHSDGTGFSNYFINAPTNGSSVQYEFHAPATATSGTNVSSVPLYLDSSVWHAGAAGNSSLKIQSVPLAGGADPGIEYRFTHSGSDTGPLDLAFTGALNLGALGSTAGCSPTGCMAMQEASTAGTPTAGVDYIRADTTSHTIKMSLNGAAEVSIPTSGGSTAFSAITAGTNTAALVIGTGGTLGTSGTGTITANAYSGLLPVVNGGLGAAPTAASQVFVSSSTSAGAWSATPAFSGSSITALSASNISAGSLAFARLTTMAADTLLGNASGSTTTPAAISLVSCSAGTNALTYNTTTHAFGCNTISGSGTVNSGTANQVAMYASTGAAVSGDSLLTDNGTTLAYTGTGGITSNGSIGLGSSPPTACSPATGCVAFSEAGTGGTPTAGVDYLRADSGTHTIKMSLNGAAEVSLPTSGGTTTIASGTAALGTSAIASGACATVVTVTATGTASTDAITWNPNASIKAVTGYTPSTSGGLTITPYPTTNAVNFDVCNWTASSETPGAVTLNLARDPMKALLAFLLVSASCCAQSLPAGGGIVSPRGGGSPPSVVQSGTTGNVATANQIVMGSAVTAGNILVVLQYGGNFTSSNLAPSDSRGNTFTQLATGGLATDDDKEAISCAPITTGGSDTIALLDGGLQTSQRAVAFEVANATCTQDVTAASTNTSAATFCTAGPITTLTANDFLVGLCGNDGTNSSLLTGGSGWTGAVTATALVVGAYRIGTSPGAFTFTSSTFASEEQGSILVALKP